ncbi:hypothetical protein L7F22_012828 [Adiantum nelumboides]|nr:hypothetical protein [Adiantum nelumboides]
MSHVPFITYHVHLCPSPLNPFYCANTQVLMMDSWGLDLNLEWDYEDFVPSTQFTEQSPTITSGSFETDASLGSLCTPQFCNQSQIGLSSQPHVIRSPLSPISNNLLCKGLSPKTVANVSTAKKGYAPRSTTTKHKSTLDATGLSTDQRAPPTSVAISSQMLPYSSAKMSPSSSANLAMKSKATPPNDEKSIPSKFFFQSGHWNPKKTVTLLDARVKLLQEKKEGSIGAILKTQDERWNYISKYCVQHGVLHSPDQCLFRWDRILAAFKKIHNYEQRIPSGKDSYWTMTSRSERLINPTNIVYDTSNDTLGDASSPPNKATTKDKDEETLVEETSSSRKKRKRGDKASILTNGLEGTTRKFIFVMDRIDARQAKHDDDVVELTRAEFEEDIAPNRKRLPLEEDSNLALREIAKAFKCVAMRASSTMGEQQI